jgi:hypothetical protein
VAVSSYLPDVAGGMVAAAAFPSDEAARQAIELLASSDVLPQEISVITRDDARSSRIAGDRAWYPGKDARGLARLIRRVIAVLPVDVRRRYAKELASGNALIVAAAGGQPSDTLAALLARAGGRLVDQWWQPPADLFAPAELAGPF